MDGPLRTSAHSPSLAEPVDRDGDGDTTVRHRGRLKWNAEQSGS